MSTLLVSIDIVKDRIIIMSNRGPIDNSQSEVRRDKVGVISEEKGISVTLGVSTQIPNKIAATRFHKVTR